jgi:hypothetical protein
LFLKEQLKGIITKEVDDLSFSPLLASIAKERSLSKGAPGGPTVAGY